MGKQASNVVRYAAFLKGINVGGHTVKMERLRALFGEIQARDASLDAVETFIASGNVVFSAASVDVRALEAAIALHLERNLGYPVPTFVRTLVELSRVAGLRPFAESELAASSSSLYVAFLPDYPGSAVAGRLESAGTETDRFKVDGSELYWLCRTRFSDSPFSGPALEKLVGMTLTVRNSTTVRKMVERFAPG